MTVVQNLKLSKFTVFLVFIVCKQHYVFLTVELYELVSVGLKVVLTIKIVFCDICFLHMKGTKLVAPFNNLFNLLLIGLLF
jgi:hypothetical protein